MARIKETVHALANKGGPRGLMHETGISRARAVEIYNQKVLTGLRAWQTWAVTLAGFAAFLVLTFTPALESLGIIRDGLATTSLIVGVLGGFSVCEWLAYPAMVDAAHELAGDDVDPNADTLVVDDR